MAQTPPAGDLVSVRRDLSHDLTAETFFAAARSAGTFEDAEGNGAQPWLVGIARNRWRAHARRAQAERRALARVAGREVGDSDDDETVDDRVSSSGNQDAVPPELAEVVSRAS